MTVSAFIIRRENNEWKCLVHMHRKAGKLMQVGGHVELDETPWQTLIYEIRDESGYEPSELHILQTLRSPHIQTAVVHPVPFLSNTHSVGNEHFHSDWCYAFTARAKPQDNVADGESTDLRWCTVAELRELIGSGECLQDIVDIYEFLLENVNNFQSAPATDYSINKPTHGEAFIP